MVQSHQGKDPTQQKYLESPQEKLKKRTRVTILAKATKKAEKDRYVVTQESTSTNPIVDTQELVIKEFEGPKEKLNAITQEPTLIEPISTQQKLVVEEK